MLSLPTLNARNCADRNEDEMQIIKNYFSFATPARGEVQDALSNPSCPSDTALILEQYKMCVESADRVTERRIASSKFFLSIHTLAFSIILGFWSKAPAAPKWTAIPVGAILIGLCYLWYATIRSARQLSGGKLQVIKQLEEYLPTKPIANAEWEALGKGMDPSLYLPVTRIERWIPVAFAIAYLAGIVAILAL
jgi:hypothetical protein